MKKKRTSSLFTKMLALVMAFTMTFCATMAVYAEQTTETYNVVFNHTDGTKETKSFEVGHVITLADLPEPGEGRYWGVVGSKEPLLGKTITADVYAFAYNHTHDSNNSVVTDPTCTEQGYTTYYCSECGKKMGVDNYVDALDHAWDDGVEVKPATCTAKGEMKYTCTRCSDTESRDIDMLAHTPAEAQEENVVDATCSADGSYDLVVRCTVCDEVLSSEPKAITDRPVHTEGRHEKTDVVDETCGTDGSYTDVTYCAVCDQPYDYVQGVVIPATGNHSWDEGVVTAEPACAAEGVKTYTCTVCSQTKTEPVPATGNHTWDEGVVTTEPTCTEDGVMTYTCTVCSQTRTEAIPAGHTLEKVDEKETTCGEAGYRAYYKCTVCVQLFVDADGTQQLAAPEEIPATGNHSWDEGIVTTEPTCAQDGVKTYTCTVCSQTTTEAVPAKHTLEKVDAKDATCGEAGYKEYYECSVCGKLFVDADATQQLAAPEEISATENHSWDEGVVTTEPTCAQDGVKTYTCTVCSQTKEETIAKLQDTNDGNQDADTNDGNKDADDTSSDQGNEATNSTSPATGDANNIVLWVSKLVIALCGVVGTSVFKRVRNAR